MIQRQCPRFHLYHAAEGDDRGCPICAAQLGDLAKTRGIWSEPDSDKTLPLDGPLPFAPDAPLAPPATATRGAAAATSAPAAPARAAPVSTDATAVAAPAAPGLAPGRTIGIYAHLGAAAEPVVGWVVCIEGPDKGCDWRLVGGRNAIGRGEGMPVQLAGDPAVSRERHAVISFDPRRRSFTLAPGDGSGLVYCNGREVVVPQPLMGGDRIELGASTLLFVPLVGESFAWGGA